MQALWKALHEGKVNLSLDTIQNRALFRLWRFSGQTGQVVQDFLFDQEFQLEERDHDQRI
jgi:hypothetical protein